MKQQSHEHLLGFLAGLIFVGKDAYCCSARLYARTHAFTISSAPLQGFDRVSIFRPGVLQRTDVAPAGGLLPSIRVADVAHAMIADAERPAGDKVAVLEMGAIQTLAKAQAASPG